MDKLFLIEMLDSTYSRVVFGSLSEQKINSILNSIKEYEERYSMIFEGIHYQYPFFYYIPSEFIKEKIYIEEEYILSLRGLDFSTSSELLIEEFKETDDLEGLILLGRKYHLIEVLDYIKKIVDNHPVNKIEASILDFSILECGGLPGWNSVDCTMID